jgi:hypothetical protein
MVALPLRRVARRQPRIDVGSAPDRSQCRTERGERLSWIFLALGVVLLVVVVVDLLWTTLWADGGAGPVASRLSNVLWRALRRMGRSRSTVVSLAGPVVLTATLVTWVVLLWAGWTFVFAGVENSLRATSDAIDVTWPGRIYFVAYAMFTMGNGDYIPVGGFWQIAAALTTASGMLLVTLAVSYVLSVLGAVAQKRSFAGTVQGFGETGSAIVRSGWNGRDLHDLDLPLSSLAADASSLADKHKTYPILHYYHSQTSENASALAVAALDEALTLIRYGTDGERLYNGAVVENTRSSLNSYLKTLNKAFIEPADEPPPRPSLAPLRDAGIPTVDDASFTQALESLEQHRRRLLGVVRADAWHWPKDAR